MTCRLFCWFSFWLSEQRWALKKKDTNRRHFALWGCKIQQQKKSVEFLSGGEIRTYKNVNAMLYSTSASPFSFHLFARFYHWSIGQAKDYVKSWKWWLWDANSMHLTNIIDPITFDVRNQRNFFFQAGNNYLFDFTWYFWSIWIRHFREQGKRNVLKCIRTCTKTCVCDVWVYFAISV